MTYNVFDDQEFPALAVKDGRPQPEMAVNAQIDADPMPEILGFGTDRMAVDDHGTGIEFLGQKRLADP